MPVHRVDRLLQWLFAKLALPFLTLCLLSTTRKSLQLSDTGFPAELLERQDLDNLQNLHSLTRPNEVLRPESSAYYHFLWGIRKLYMPITMWLGIAYLALCSRPRWAAIFPVAIATACKAVSKCLPQGNCTHTDVLELHTISISSFIIVISFLLYQISRLLNFSAKDWKTQFDAFDCDTPARLDQHPSQNVADYSLAGARDGHVQTTQKQRRHAKRLQATQGSAS